MEILPSGTAFDRGDAIIAIVQGRDILDYPPSVYARHQDTINSGRHRIHFGGPRPSRIVLPIIESGPE